MLEKSTIEINGKEYNFLKPHACDLIDIEDQSFEGGSFNAPKFNKLMLGLVSQKIKIEDLVEFILPEITLSSGDKIVVVDVGYEKHQEAMLKIEKRTRTNFCKELLKLSGVVGVIDLNCFSYEDINLCANSFLGLYDDSKLSEAVEAISGFCFPSEER